MHLTVAFALATADADEKIIRRIRVLHEQGLETFRVVQDTDQQLQIAGAAPLGNLRFVDNLLISATPLKTTAFELTSSFEAKLAARIQADPNDPWSLLQKAKLAETAEVVLVVEL